MESKAKDESGDDDVEMSAPTTTLLSTLAPDDLLQRSSTAAEGQICLTTGLDSMPDPTDDNFFAALQEAVGEEGDNAAADEFDSEKRAVEEEEAPKDLDTFLPGWNRWSGPGTEADDDALRKKRLIKAPRRKRKDRGRAKVIIRERVNEDLKKHLVSPADLLTFKLQLWLFWRCLVFFASA